VYAELKIDDLPRVLQINVYLESESREGFVKQDYAQEKDE